MELQVSNHRGVLAGAAVASAAAAAAAAAEAEVSPTFRPQRHRRRQPPPATGSRRLPAAPQRSAGRCRARPGETRDGRAHPSIRGGRRPPRGTGCLATERGGRRQRLMLPPLRAPTPPPAGPADQRYPSLSCTLVVDHTPALSMLPTRRRAGSSSGLAARRPQARAGRSAPSDRTGHVRWFLPQRTCVHARPQESPVRTLSSLAVLSSPSRLSGVYRVAGTARPGRAPWRRLRRIAVGGLWTEREQAAASSPLRNL